jgi:hypothetical protein
VGFGHIFKLCIYSLTFPSLFKAVLLNIGISLPSIIYVGLLVFYIYIGLKNSKNFDFTNNTPKNNIPEDGIVLAEF